MCRCRARRKVEGLLSLTVEVRSVRPDISVHPMGGRGKEPRIECGFSLDVQGDLDSPVKDVFDITISVHPDEPLRAWTARPVAAGAILGIRHEVSAVVSLLRVDLDGLWLFALSGHLKYASLTFTPPEYGSALVVNTSFSSERQE